MNDEQIKIVDRSNEIINKILSNNLKKEVKIEAY